MSLEVSASSAEVIQNAGKDSTRRSADYHPSIWGDHFLQYTSDSQTMDSTTQEQYEALKQDVRSMIMAAADKPITAKKLKFIDAVQRLGVAYHFGKEIEDATEKICYDDDDLDNDSDDLCTVSLRFRLLRQQGIKISCDVFEKFKDDEGKFKASLVKNVQGMLSLYEAAHLAIRGEDILDEAIAFTTTHLKSMVSDHAACPNNLAEQINHALYRSIRRTLPRLEARYFLDIYPTDNDSNENNLLKLARLDFNLLQAAYQKELSEISQWWKELDFSTKLPYARDRLVELYLWIVGVYFEPKFSWGRIILTKVVYLTSAIDDTFDAYGTLEELKLFTEASKSWDIGAMDKLPEYMKILYKALLDVYSEMEEQLAKEGRLYCIPYAKEKMEEVIEMYFVEAKWFFEGYVPTMEEYIPIASKTGGNIMLTTISYVGMGDIATKEAFDWLCNIPTILKASLLICRLTDDMVTHKFEQKRGHLASAVECYMTQHGVPEEEAYEALSQHVANAWKDINEEFLKPTAVPSPLLERIFNLTRIVEFSYKFHDSYTNSYLMKDHVASILRDPVML